MFTLYQNIPSKKKAARFIENIYTTFLFIPSGCDYGKKKKMKKENQSINFSSRKKYQT